MSLGTLRSTAKNRLAVVGGPALCQDLNLGFGCSYVVVDGAQRVRHNLNTTVFKHAEVILMEVLFRRDPVYRNPHTRTQVSRIDQRVDIDFNQSRGDGVDGDQWCLGSLELVGGDSERVDCDRVVEFRVAEGGFANENADHSERPLRLQHC